MPNIMRKDRQTISRELLHNAFRKIEAVKPQIVEQIPAGCNGWRLKLGKLNFGSPKIETYVQDIRENPMKITFNCKSPIKNDEVCKGCILNNTIKKGGVVYFK